MRGAAGPHARGLTGLLADGSAIIETAEIVGITDPVGMGVPVEARSTRGMGEAIRALLDVGVRRFFVALGGSSTNDGGAGLLAGLGLKLFDAQDKELDATPEQLARVARLDVSQLDARLADTQFVGMSDVDNPLTGDHGATAVFGPQKGVKPEQVAPIDAALARFADLLEAALGRTARDQPGAGAAGGLGFALHMLGAQFEPGAETVARQIGLDAALEGANWLITGEGHRTCKRCTVRRRSLLAVMRRRRACRPRCSPARSTQRRYRASPNTSVAVSPAPGPITLEVAIRDAARLLADEAEQLTRLKYGTR